MFWTAFFGKFLTVLPLAAFALPSPEGRGLQEPFAATTLSANSIPTLSFGFSPRPLVIWHGLGDTAAGPGMAALKEDIETMYPGIYIKSVKVPADGSEDDERKAGFVSCSSAMSTSSR